MMGKRGSLVVRLAISGIVKRASQIERQRGSGHSTILRTLVLQAVTVSRREDEVSPLVDQVRY